MDMPLLWTFGIDHKSGKTALPVGAVTDAVNIDIDRAGGVNRRLGYSSLLAQAGCHDVWSSEVRGDSFAIVGGALCQVHVPWSATSLQALTQDAAFSYTDLNGEVVCGSRYDALVIKTDSTVRRLGLETPGAPGLAAAGSGGLDAGTYGVALAYLCGSEEGALSRAAFVELTVGQGLSLTVPQPIEALPTAIRVYRTQANGDVFYRCGDIPLAMTTYILGVGQIGRQADNWRLERMPPGDFWCYWKGLLWCVRGSVAFHSEPLRYGLYDPKFNFVQFGAAVRLFLPVEGGIFVGTKDGIFFLSGSGPKEFSVRKTGGKAPISGTGIRFPASNLKDGTGEYVAAWLASNGFVVGHSDGGITEPQSKRIALSGNVGSAATYAGRLTAVVADEL
jgi:hypothetical protein